MPIETMNVQRYRGRLPDLRIDDVVLLTGRDKRRGDYDREFKRYVRRVEDGYELATLTSEGDWSFGTATLKHNPTTMFYQELRHVGPDEWPTHHYRSGGVGTHADD